MTDASKEGWSTKNVSNVRGAYATRTSYLHVKCIAYTFMRVAYAQRTGRAFAASKRRTDDGRTTQKSNSV
jgi:hypothetical protein